MMKTLCAAVFALLFATTVAAQTTTPTVRPGAGDLQENVQQKAEDLRRKAQEAQEARERFRQNAQEQRETFRESVKEKRDALQERVKTDREALKEKLKVVRDERKKMAVEKIDDQIARLNERMVNHFTNVLNKLSSALERIVTRAGKAEGRGLDVSSVRSVVTEAEAALASAKTAVSAQAAKTYPITVNTEATLKADVGAVRKALHDDLARVRDAVHAAHQTVKKAAVTLAQIPRVDEPAPAPTPTSTATTTATTTSQ